MTYLNDASSENIIARKKKATADVTGQLRRFLVIQHTITPKHTGWGGGEREREKREGENRSGYSGLQQ